jgi:ATP-dependent helicase/nuclease subunit A
MTTRTVDSRALGLRLVSASAGSGKTFCITEHVTQAVDPSSTAPIEIEGLVGVTYTTKAQAELQARIRRALVERGAFERAQQLPLAYLGTVHSVCLRLVKEFALDAGLSPEVDVIPGNEGRRLLQAVLEHELAPPHHLRLLELAFEFQLAWDGRTSRTDWITPVDDIMTLARGNRIRPGELPGMAQRSIAGLLAILPPSAASSGALEAELAASIEVAIRELSRLGDDTKMTENALKELLQAKRALAAGTMTWSAWAKLSRLTPSKRVLPLVAPVQAAAAAYEAHPKFQADLCELTTLLFDAARVGLAAYAEWKARRGLIDYVDMIDLALEILDVRQVADELCDRLQLVVVDEFQDTSPIQLALFTRLHALSGNSVWVGDRKQCIFEYAGADPTLMEAVTAWAEASGGQRDYLRYNYRSRPELVDATSALFSAAFTVHGDRPEEVATTAKRPSLAEQDALPPVGLWWLEGKEQPAIAQGVIRLLQIPSATPVVDRATGKVRALRPSDIAILVYSNLDAARLSAALEAHGIATALPRVGLLSTPEGTLVSAALRFLVDRRDTLASAEIEALTGFGAGITDGSHPADRWLSERIRAQSEKRDPEALHSAEATDPDANSPALALLEQIRPQLRELSPAEAVDRVLAVIDLATLAMRWPDPQQRLANLDALRALAAAYEERCSYQREAASLGGLLRYFDQTQQVIRQRDEERATDEQHVGCSDAAVVISTYHKAKGLEWPVVILGGLGRERRRDAFDVTPETDREAFDASDPLGGRWIRYWPWPLGNLKAVPLADRAENSAVGRAIAEREARERVRLLYVGCTRARDHLILAVPLLKKGPAKAWLDELHDHRGPLLALPDPDTADPHLVIRGPDQQRLNLPVRTWSLRAADPPERPGPPTTPRLWFARASTSPSSAPPYRIAPSRAAEEQLALPSAHVISSRRFTRRMPFVSPKGASWDRIGSALHAFLAADHPELTPFERTQLAERILHESGLAAAFTSDVAIAASDALRAFIAERWPVATWHREIPISAALTSPAGQRRIEGAIDLLLETPDGFVIIDHKSFPGKASEWEPRALAYAPQLLTYSKAIRLAGGKVIGRFVHFTIGGGMVEIGEGAA